MKNKVQLIPVVCLLSLALVGNAVQLNAQGTAPTGDYTNAVIAEVRDAQGLVVLRGQFVLADEEGQAGATFTFVVDGNDLATVTADRRGRVEVELEVRLPGAPASR